MLLLIASFFANITVGSCIASQLSANAVRMINVFVCSVTNADDSKVVSSKSERSTRR